MERKSNEVSVLPVWLDSYDDLFSDFDPRSYLKRTLSDDFISQLKKMTRSSGRKIIGLQLLLPEKVRNAEDEKMVARRLHQHFHTMNELLTSQIRKSNKRGIVLVLAGVCAMLLAGYISFIRPAGYGLHILRVLSEPAGWFMLWAGLDMFIYSTNNAKRELVFYTKMSHAEITFGTF